MMDDRVLPAVGRVRTPRERLHGFIVDRCILTADDGWIASTKGGDYAWLIDMRQAFLVPEALELISEMFWDQHENQMPFQVGGLEIAAIPLVIAIQMKGRERGQEVNGFILRKERKTSGIGKIVEGRIGSEPIIAVDDILNSAGSMEKVRVTLDSIGHQIDSVFVVVDYHSPKGSGWLETHRLTAKSIFSLADFGLTDGYFLPKAPRRKFETVWNFRSPDANHFYVVPKSSPVVAGDKVLFGSDRGTFWARHTQTGELDWQFQVAHPGRKGIWSRPLVVDDRVYFGAYDGNLYCLDIHDGREAWRSNDADWIGSSPIASPADGLLWVGLERECPANRGAIAAFNLFTGDKVWEAALPDYVHSTPAFSACFGAVAIGCNDGGLRLFDARSGMLRWSFATGGEIKDAPLFDEARKLVYACALDGMIRAVDVDSGCQVWAMSTTNNLRAAPMLHNDRLFVAGTDKYLHVVDLTTNQARTIELGSKSVCTAVALDGSIFLGTNGGRVLEVDQEGRAILGSLQLPDPVTSQIAHCHRTGMFFATTYMNEIFAFRRAD